MGAQGHPPTLRSQDAGLGGREGAWGAHSPREGLPCPHPRVATRTEAGEGRRWGPLRRGMPASLHGDSVQLTLWINNSVSSHEVVTF